MSRVNSLIKKITQTVEEKGKYAWYLVDPNNQIKLVSKGSDRTDVKEAVCEKLEGLTKYNGCYIYQVAINIFSIKKNIIGPIQLSIKKHQIINEKPVHLTKFLSGVIWYTVDELQEIGFKFEQIKQIIEILNTNKRISINALKNQTIGGVL